MLRDILDTRRPRCAEARVPRCPECREHRLIFSYVPCPRDAAESAAGVPPPFVSLEQTHGYRWDPLTSEPIQSTGFGEGSAHVTVAPGGIVAGYDGVAHGPPSNSVKGARKAELQQVHIQCMAFRVRTQSLPKSSGTVCRPQSIEMIQHCW